MSESPVFEWTSDALARHTSLSGLEARGTLRLVLKDAGLEPRNVSKGQMAVVITRLLASALAKCKIDEAETLCKFIGSELEAAQLASPLLEAPEDVFARLGGRRPRGA